VRESVSEKERRRSREVECGAGEEEGARRGRNKRKEGGFWGVKNRMEFFK